MAVDPADEDLETEASKSDVAQTPSESAAADPDTLVSEKIPADLRNRYEFFSYRSAALILSERHSDEFAEVLETLRNFAITKAMISKAGGNESDIPKLLSSALRPMGWHETVIQGDLLVKLLWKEQTGTKRGKAVFEKRQREFTRAKFIDGHKIDYVKNKVAFDMEWNSKDQTFDRDLYAFSAFSQCGVIDVGIVLTRSEKLNPVFKDLGIAHKYGASTTWMGKLLFRLNAGRNGGCPVLAIGITPSCIKDWRS